MYTSTSHWYTSIYPILTLLVYRPTPVRLIVLGKNEILMLIHCTGTPLRYTYEEAHTGNILIHALAYLLYFCL